mmetsp:Transcript_21591/g.69714  ORF Transcript_21591/g.69714 Transcript_21591/m.69714 type:complete len:155 (-) Transcript_21591:570-1034(-)
MLGGGIDGGGLLGGGITGGGIVAGGKVGGGMPGCGMPDVGITVGGIWAKVGVYAGDDDSISRLAHSSSAIGAYLELPAAGSVTGESSKLGSGRCNLPGEAVSNAPRRVGGGALSPSVTASASFSRSTDQVWPAAVGSSVQLRIRTPAEAESPPP